MSTRFANIISLIGIVVLAAYVAWMYPSLPDPMPTHWNAAGEVDGWSSKPLGAAIIGGMALYSFPYLQDHPRDLTARLSHRIVQGHDQHPDDHNRYVQLHLRYRGHTRCHGREY